MPLSQARPPVPRHAHGAHFVPVQTRGRQHVQDWAVDYWHRASVWVPRLCSRWRQSPASRGTTQPVKLTQHLWPGVVVLSMVAPQLKISNQPWFCEIEGNIGCG